MTSIANDPPTANEPGDLAAAFVTLNGNLSSGGDRQTALQRLVDLAVQMVPGCHWAAITAWPATKGPRILSSSDGIAARLDELQHELGEGPCLTAASDSEIVHIPDFTESDEFARFAAAAQAHSPARGVLSYHLADIPNRTALNLYSRTPGAYDTEAISTAALFAAHARVMLIHAASTDKIVNLETALTTSRQIGAAIGILMNAHKITADAAFEMLRTSSQHLHRKLHEIAYDVTQTGTLPDKR